MFSFLHAADLHLGTPFGGYPQHLRQLLLDYQLDCLDYLVSFGLENKVEAILFAGDLFDNPRPSLELVDRVISSVRPLKEEGIPFYLALGNHDAGLDLEQFKDSGIYIMDSQAPSIYKHQAWSLDGLSFESQWDPRRPYEILEGGSEGFRLGLLHSAEGVYLPLSREEVEDLAYDYLALGHVHSFTRFGKRAYYSGNLSQIDGPGGFIYYREGYEVQHISAPAFPIEDRVFKLENLAQDLDRLTSYAYKPVRLILEGRLEAGELEYLNRWLADKPGIFFLNKVVEASDIDSGPLYQKSLELLEKNPRLIVEGADLLELDQDEALNYLKENAQELLAELLDFFRGEND
ncbi:MAG: DNA repair exonuclease [Tissierellia bacterium]|nr:DNA repair exonuclease [Tissierellia bacterium]